MFRELIDLLIAWLIVSGVLGGFELVVGGQTVPPSSENSKAFIPGHHWWWDDRWTCDAPEG